MKNLFIIFISLTVLSLGQVLAQQQGVAVPASWFGASQFDTEPQEVKLLAPSKTYPPKPKSPTSPAGCDSLENSYVRVNIHWVQRTDGSGNFTETDDGGVTTGGNINGYNRAEMLIDRMNRHWRVNAPMAFPPGNTIPVFDTKIRFVLSRVNFIQDDDYYGNGAKNGLGDWSILSQYGINVWQEINIFMIEAEGHIGASGVANQLGSPNLSIPLATKVYDEWTEEYANPIAANAAHAADPFYIGGNTGILHGGTVTTKVISHEIAHLLSIRHLTGNDGCGDTQTHPNNCWSCPHNNVMDYTGHIPYAFTPCQIGRMHHILDWDGSFYVEECGDCLPANAYFDMPTSVCMDDPNHQIIMDAGGSYNEAKYIVWVYEVANVGDWQSIGPVWKGFGNNGLWTTGQAGFIDVKTIPPSPSDIQPWKVYRVLLAVQNYKSEKEFCTQWDQYVRWISPVYCSLVPSGDGKRLSNSDKPSFKLYPNPTNDRITIQCDLTAYQQAEVSLFTIQGQQVLTAQLEVTNNQSPLDVGHLPRGTYMVRLTADGRPVSHHKLVISR